MQVTVNVDVVIDVFDALTDRGYLPNIHRRYIIGRAGIGLVDGDEDASGVLPVYINICHVRVLQALLYMYICVGPSYDTLNAATVGGRPWWRYF